MEGRLACDDTRLPCKYGQKCYQKNPLHHQKYKHPPKRKIEVSIVLIRVTKSGYMSEEKQDCPMETRVSNAEVEF